MFLRKPLQVILAVFCFVFLLLQSCKSDPQKEGISNLSTEPFTVVSHLNAEPDMIHPLLSTSGYTRSVTNQIFSNLVHYNTKTLELSPMLVKSVPQSQEVTDGDYKGMISRTYEIHDEAVWGDEEPVTGHDVAFSLKAVMNPKVPTAQYRSFAKEIKDVVVDESNPKKFTTYSSDYFLGDYIFTDIPVFPAHIYDPEGLMNGFSVKQLADVDEAAKLTDDNLQKFADLFISEKYSRNKDFVKGSGPYELVEWQAGQQIIVKKKENWWGNKLAKDYPLLIANPTEIVFRPIADPTTAATELKSGGIDFMSMIAPDQYDQLKKSIQAQNELNLFEPELFQIYYIGINNNRPYLSDKRVRRALAHLVDKDEVIKVIMNGFAKKIVSPVHPSKAHYNDKLPPIDFNIEKARTLLKEAGWEDTNGNGIVDKVVDGERMELKLAYLASKGGRGGRIGELMIENAKKAGVEIKLDAKESNLVRQLMSKRDYDLATGAWGQDPSLDDLYQNWHTDNDVPSGGNRFGFGDEKSDAVIEKIRSRVSSDERTKLYKEIQQIIYDEQPCVFLLTPTARMAVNKKFNYSPSLRKPNIFENEFTLSKNQN